MIGRLTGILVSKQPPQIVIDAGGVGYEVDVSMQTFYTLPALGEQIVLHTQLIVREDAHLLFGFASENERQTFRALIKVGGIGAKTALGILSAMSSEDLARAIADEDWKTLSAAPGIGKKTAERMILELRGKLAPEGMPNVAAADTISHDGREDVVSTLLALGYNEREARGVTKHLTSDIEVGEGVRQALKLLMK